MLALADIIQGIETTKQRHIKFTRSPDDDIVPIIDAIGKNPNIISVDLSYNQIKPGRESQAIIRMLHNNASIQKVCLIGNLINQQFKDYIVKKANQNNVRVNFEGETAVELFTPSYNRTFLNIYPDVAKQLDFSPALKL